jgi:hypothetical protein
LWSDLVHRLDRFVLWVEDATTDNTDRKELLRHVVQEELVHDTELPVPALPTAPISRDILQNIEWAGQWRGRAGQV